MSDTPSIDMAKRVGQYVQLRDTIKQMEKEHEEKLSPYKEMLEQLNTSLLQHLDNTGSESVKTSAGTVYKSRRDTASLADASAFMDHVIQHQAWHLLDRRANPTAVRGYLEEKECLPPGVNFTTIFKAGVRRS